MTTPTSCYEPVPGGTDRVETFEPTSLSVGPWDDRLQHGGPVAALLTRSLDRLPTEAPGRIARLTVEILRPVTTDRLWVSARVLRPGRKVSLLEAQMHQVGRDGREVLVASARAWRLATSDSEAIRHVPDEVLPPVDPAELADPDKQIASVLDRGFVAGLTWVVRTPMNTVGASTTAWARVDRELVRGERTTDLERLVMVADCANGVGMRADPTAWTFMNTDLTIHLHTAPRGAWVGLVAESCLGADGVGTSTAVLHDEHGPVGRVAQALLVESR